jgi:hypothetical protein
MRPNTPHFVLTPEAAICHGGHFYAMSTIQDTVFGLYHMFVASKQITNTEHSHDAHLLLRRMLIHTHYILVKHGSNLHLTTEATMVHVPAVTTFEGTLDLFMLCVIMELGDLINPLAYKKKYRHGRDCNRDRLCTIHARGLSRDLREWWRARYVFYDPVTKSHRDGNLVFNDLFSQQVHALISYKKAAEEKEIQGEERECTAEVLESLVKKYFSSAQLSFNSGLPDKGFEWLGSKYVVQAQSGLTPPYIRCRYSNFVALNPFTTKFQAGMSSP